MSSNAPERYIVTFTCDVSADHYRQLQSRVKEIREGIPKTLNSNPNLDGYYIRVHDHHSTIRPRKAPEDETVD
jgi:hypothetical protein